jgi:hypothetical protein
MTSDYAIVRHYPKAQTDRVSVSAWVWADALDPWGTIVQGRSPSVASNGQYVDQFYLGVNPDLVLTATVLQRDGQEIRAQERGKVLPRRRWQHVAFVADGSLLRLYRNGVEVAASPCDGIDPRLSARTLAIGALLEDLDATLRQNYTGCWNGRLDEIAVFNRALTADDIAALCRGRRELQGATASRAVEAHPAKEAGK